MVKLNSEMKVGTDAATVTDVQVNHVSQTIAKPHVSSSAIPKPTMEFYGFTDKCAGGFPWNTWQIEGGEEAYYDALQKWKDAQ